MGFFCQDVRKRYEDEVRAALGIYSQEATAVLTENDIAELPELVKKYIKYVGALGKPKVWNFRVEMSGKMRSDENQAWMAVNSVQYNFIGRPVRVFFIKGSKFGIPAYGLHSYKNEEGIMLIKVLGLFPVVDQRGAEMNISDTVTVFNDMCVFAPATLVDKRIAWGAVGNNTVEAAFTNGNNRVSALLHFNETGELVNFVSADRYKIDGKIERPTWSTPICGYKNYAGLYLSARASAKWHYPDREFSYAEFDVMNIEYNVKTLK